jgi:hypothetical protein
MARLPFIPDPRKAAALLMLAGVLYAALGPSICRAIMAPQPTAAPEACCGSTAGSSSEAPDGRGAGDPHESCPLNSVGLLKLLPASHRQAAVPDADFHIGSLEDGSISPDGLSPALLSEWRSVDQRAMRFLYPHARLFLQLRSLRI